MFLAGEIGGYDSGGRGPYDDFWYGPIPGKTTAGVRVNDDTAMRLAIFFACVNVIAADLAKVPLALFRRKDDGGRERVLDHPVIKLLRAPERNLTSIDWKQSLQAQQLMRGNGFAEIRTNFRGQVVELPRLKPDNMRVELRENRAVRYLYRDPKTGVERVYVEGEIVHFRGLSLDGPLGLSPVDVQKEALGEGVAVQSYGSSFFANDARPSIWLEHPSHFKDESQKRDWLSAFKRAFGSGNRFSPMLTEYGIKINTLDPVDHTALQFIELRKMKAMEICSMFRVPPHKVGILDRSTNNNIEHQGIEYGTDCLLTWCRRWEERLAQDLLTEDERDEYYFEFVLDALMRGDAQSRFEAYQSGIQAGWLTRNEARRRENLDALPDLDKPLEPVNMAPAGSNPNAPGKGKPTPTPANGGDVDDDAQEEARGRELELQARRRVLNRETRALEREWERCAGNLGAFVEGTSSFYVKHLPFVMEALALDRPRAEAYCFAQTAELERAIADGSVPHLLARWQAGAEQLKFPPLPAAIPRKETA